MANRMAPNVAAGMALLDVAMPGWYNKIDLATLDIGGYSNCILGQLYGGYKEGASRLLHSENPSLELRHYFAFTCQYADYSTKEWKKRIKLRLRRDRDRDRKRIKQLGITENMQP